VKEVLIQSNAANLTALREEIDREQTLISYKTKVTLLTLCQDHLAQRQYRKSDPTRSIETRETPCGRYCHDPSRKVVCRARTARRITRRRGQCGEGRTVCTHGVITLFGTKHSDHRKGVDHSDHSSHSVITVITVIKVQVTRSAASIDRTLFSVVVRNFSWFLTLVMIHCSQDLLFAQHP